MNLYSVIFLLVIGYTGLSGFNDGGNLVATFAATRSLKLSLVIPLLILSIGLGPILFGTAVSRTIATQIINFPLAGPLVVTASLLGAIATLIVTWRLSLPTSTTLALGGAMAGAAFTAGQGRLIHWTGILKILLGLLGSVAAGFVFAAIITFILWTVLSRLSLPQALHIRRLQYFIAIWQGMAYGANDQEKAIGLTALVFLMMHHKTRYQVSWVDIVLPLLAWSVGLLLGGTRVARTVGNRVVRIKSINAVGALTAATLTVTLAAMAGLPISTTQTVDASLIGMGTTLNPAAVHWLTVKNIVRVWILTIPIAMALGIAAMALCQFSRSVL